jgi:Plasmid pRiA4b ORF-3-like protein
VFNRSQADGNEPPVVVGARARPPEDVGGLNGYADFLDIIADPENSEHGDTKLLGGRLLRSRSQNITVSWRRSASLVGGETGVDLALAAGWAKSGVGFAPRATIVQSLPILRSPWRRVSRDAKARP